MSKLLLLNVITEPTIGTLARSKSSNKIGEDI